MGTVQKDIMSVPGPSGTQYTGIKMGHNTPPRPRTYLQHIATESCLGSPCVSGWPAAACS